LVIDTVTLPTAVVIAKLAVVGGISIVTVPTCPVAIERSPESGFLAKTGTSCEPRTITVPISPVPAFPETTDVTVKPLKSKTTSPFITLF